MKDNNKWPWKTMCLVSSVISKETGEVEQHFDVNTYGCPVEDDPLEEIAKLANTISERVEFHLQHEDPFRGGKPHTIAILATCWSKTNVDTEIIDYVAHEPLKYRKRYDRNYLYEPCQERDKFMRNLIDLFPESCRSFAEREVNNE